MEGWSKVRLERGGLEAPGYRYGVIVLKQEEKETQILVFGGADMHDDDLSGSLLFTTEVGNLAGSTLTPLEDMIESDSFEQNN